MKRWKRWKRWLVGVAALACACGSSEGERPSAAVEPAPAVEPSASPRPPVADATTAQDAREIPESWVWVTDTRGRLEVAMPALPRSFVSPGPGAGEERVLMAERAGASFTVVSKPAEGPDALDQLERKLQAAGTVSQRVAWREQGFGLLLATAAGSVPVRAMVQGGRLYTLEVIGNATAEDAERFFDSLEPRPEPRRGAVHDPARGYRVQAPARMGRWLDVSGVPPLTGHRGVLDGHQLMVSVNDLLLVPDPEDSLDGSVTAMRQELDAELVEIDPQPFLGRPSRRLELRGREGVYATIRLVLDGSRLYQAAVYAPSGYEAEWADAYVDSLVVGE